MAPVDGVTRVVADELIALRRQLPRRMAASMDRVHNQRAGTQHAATRGRGMDYRESRAYQHGDDIRRLDWRLTARSGHLHTKLFQEEREQGLMLLLDTHASMQFGTRCRFKSVQAARAAALAAWIGVASGMRVGLASYGLRQGLIRPQGGTRGVLSLIHSLCEGVAPDAGDASARIDPLSAALRRIMRLARGGTQVLLISDGSSLDDGARAGLLALHRQAKVRVLVVADALESVPPPAGRYPLVWHDGARTLTLETRAARMHFRDVLGRGPRELQALATALGLPCRRIDTAAEPLSVVAALLGISLRRHSS